MRFKLVHTVIFLFIALAGYSQVRFIAKAPSSVRAGQRFYLQYEVNQQGGSGFKSGNISAFTNYGGPSQSSSSQISVVNGQMTQSVSISYTYVLAASKEGSYTISPGSITVGGKTYKSNPVTIKVVGKSESVQSNEPQVNEISSEDLFARIYTNKKTAHVGEPIVATVKLYTRVQLERLNDVKVPQFDGFWKEEIDTRGSTIKWNRENINGKTYNSGILIQFVLMPQKSGKLTIDPMDLDVVAFQEVKRRRRRNMFNDPFFDDFFSSSSYQRVNKKLKSNEVTIDVSPIPSDALTSGDFQISSEITTQKLKANESLTLKITVSGSGNLKMIEPFNIDFPPEFEVFEPETKSNINVTAAGITGSKTFEYLVIPRHKGNYTIPAASLKYYNPKLKKTIESSSEEYDVEVLKGDKDSNVQSVDHSTNKEDIKYFGKDIRFIKTNTAHPGQPEFWFKSTSYFLTLGGIGVAFGLLFFVTRRRRRDKEDVSGYKSKKAALLARKQLKSAEKYIASDDKSSFYAQLLISLYGYLEDKVKLKRSDHSKENIKNTLNEKGVSDVSVNKFIALIEKAEMARYAPVSDIPLSNEFEHSVEVISELESQLS